LVGVFILSHEKIQEKLEKYCWWFIISAFILGIGYAFAIQSKWSGLLYDIFYFYYGYIMVLGLLGIGGKFINSQNKTMIHASQRSMLYYIFHYPILTGIAFVLMPYIKMEPIQMVVFIIVSFIITLIMAEIIQRIPVIRVFFGLKAALKR
jgi:surface polysaccharide O-acyltransferase-like enzyme